MSGHLEIDCLICHVSDSQYDPVARAQCVADACRINVLSMVAEAGSGHLGTSFSCLDVLAWLHLEAMGPEDRYFSSKGHDAPALYAMLIALGRLDFELLHRLRRLNGLPGQAALSQMYTGSALTWLRPASIVPPLAVRQLLVQLTAAKVSRVVCDESDGLMLLGQILQDR